MAKSFTESLPFFPRCKSIILTPGEFFRKPLSPELSPALTHFAWVFLLLSILVACINLMFGLLAAAFSFDIGMVIGTLINIAVLLFVVTLMIIPAITCVAISSGVMHIFVKLFGGKRNYTTTFKINLYASTLAIFSTIPGVNVIAFFYQLFITAIGISKQHKISMGNAGLVAILPLLAFLLVALITLFIALVVVGISIASLVAAFIASLAAILPGISSFAA